MIRQVQEPSCSYEYPRLLDRAAIEQIRALDYHAQEYAVKRLPDPIQLTTFYTSDRGWQIRTQEHPEGTSLFNPQGGFVMANF